MPRRRKLTLPPPDQPCSECGQLHITARGHQSCQGHVRYDRATYVKGQDRKPLDRPRPCRQNPNIGLSRCDAHGGGAEKAKAAGEQRMAEEEARRLLRRFGSPVDTSPTEALLDTVKWTAGYVAWLRDKVAGDRDTAGQLVEQDDEKALTQLSTHTGKRETGIWVELLGQWSDRLVKVCDVAIRAGIEERRVRIAEQQGALVADVIRKILSDLELTPEQVSKAGEVVPFRLRALAS